ncbi:hypothetical protein SGR_7126t [Streptomyces griseus subsp. griseus NBRC 13350]|uniref:Glycosyl hydrolase family 30 beta sandwich domain-containing protein n=1 Tax=Streptomyces griseus subsp. griseus (strain JCM 4626 / CBS 651.72 / NBRC 13350 / KCC S-0626 / ISP 5235) TaxID=455632 RepID=B1VKL1_STRGG|nr:hypothetical protein SGR_13t [Streptomyces griseus subsp. griseus NBRC 13350]BAG23953.1 hypothetical protein SGR_7126t [Streptomyces griseus subsp. griseus NBRC 13350]
MATVRAALDATLGIPHQAREVRLHRFSNADGPYWAADPEFHPDGTCTALKPGAQRIASTDNATVQNVAWRNPDGSRALIAQTAAAPPSPSESTGAASPSPTPSRHAPPPPSPGPARPAAHHRRSGR